MEMLSRQKSYDYSKCGQLQMFHLNMNIDMIVYFLIYYRIDLLMQIFQYWKSINEHFL